MQALCIMPKRWEKTKHQMADDAHAAGGPGGPRGPGLGGRFRGGLRGSQPAVLVRAVAVVEAAGLVEAYPVSESSRLPQESQSAVTGTH
ncbi:hypothetical protein A6R68_21079 [Neotoma lepida]|uniref:Uncharacterized protein n=1 Tax=Neotoma lepida TaxID=56216 RepID=A0A1A6HQI6_NEOLE|nr:hypothetical protein A6R68_21079 [Neotoma lepida]